MFVHVFDFFLKSSKIKQNLHTDLRIEILRRSRSARPHLNYRVWSSDILNFWEGYNNNNNNNNNHVFLSQTTVVSGSPFLLPLSREELHGGNSLFQTPVGRSKKQGYCCCCYCTPPLQFPLFLIRNSICRFSETHFLVQTLFLSKKGYNHQNFLRASRESK